MYDSLALPLPPLRRKILRTFLLMVFIYGVVGVLMMSAVFLASGITPKAMHMNYDSIAAANEMKEAIISLRYPSDHAGRSRSEWVAQFDRALRFEEGNITEPNENMIAGDIRKLWNSSKTNIDPIPTSDFLPKFKKIISLLDGIVSVNQLAMFTLAEESTAIRHRVFTGAIFIFFLVLLVAVYLADGLASRLSSPLKEMAEAFRNKPMPGEKLRLPTPTSLELRILTHEINQLWKRLSELRKLNVEEIATQRSKLEIVLEAVEDGIIVIDNSNNVVQCNEGLLKILRLPSELVVGHRWNDLPTSDDDYLKLRDKLSGETDREDTVDLMVADRPRTFAIRIREIVNKLQQSIGRVYLLHDITEKKQRERLKTEFIGVLSHEIKTPLQSLGTAIELLLKRQEGMTSESKMLLETVSEDVARIRAVAQDFVQVGLVDSRYLRLTVGRHALSELIPDWVKPFKIVARDRRVTVELEVQAHETLFANIDVVKFPWAISNLLSNAIRFSPQDSIVTVAISGRDENIFIEIRDQGPGIPEPVRKKMFDPYFQAPPSDSATPSGFLGLGLTIAKEVVEAHRGKLEYIPGDPKGSIFRITLPHWYETGDPHDETKF